MNARLVKLVKHDLSSRDLSVFAPVSSISKTEILSGKYSVKFYWILPDSGILPDTGIQYIPRNCLLCPPLVTPLISSWSNIDHFSMLSTSVDNVNVLMCGVTK